MSETKQHKMVRELIDEIHPLKEPYKCGNTTVIPDTKQIDPIELTIRKTETGWAVVSTKEVA
jgi:hypothetical protein